MPEPLWVYLMALLYFTRVSTCSTIASLQRRLDALEAENRALRQQVAAYEQTAAGSTPRR